MDVTWFFIEASTHSKYGGSVAVNSNSYMEQTYFNGVFHLIFITLLT